MALDADTVASARIVEKGDPWRFRTVMAAPIEARRILFPLYALNVEVSRAPWVTQEPMIAEMRLQWWHDALQEITKGGLVRRHEVVTPLAHVLSQEDAESLCALVEARRWDVYREPFEDSAHFKRYIGETSGTLMWVAAKLLGAADEATTRDLGFASGLAAFLRAVPALEAAGRVPLVDGRPEGVKALAAEGLTAFANRPRQINPAHWPAAGTGHLLKRIARKPSVVADGQIAPAPGPWALMKATVLGRL